jgi:hypothetical protein
MAKVITLDPVTKLPIWPGGIVPPHPTDKDGKLIVAPPVFQPKLEPFPRARPVDEPEAPDPFQDFNERLNVMQQTVDPLGVELEFCRVQILSIQNDAKALHAEDFELAKEIAALAQLDGMIQGLTTQILALTDRVAELETRHVDPV